MEDIGEDVGQSHIEISNNETNSETSNAFISYNNESSDGFISLDETDHAVSSLDKNQYLLSEVKSELRALIHKFNKLQDEMSTSLARIVQLEKALGTD